MTRVSGNANVEVGALLTMAEVNALAEGTVVGNYVDCHSRHCCSTTKKRNIECIEGSGWAVCHSQCDHSENQL